MTSKHFLNGKIVDEKDLLISPRDLGYLRGYAVFDFLKTYGGKPFKLKEHIDRLYHSAELVGMSVPWSKEQVIQWIEETMAANEAGEKFIKIVLSGGKSGDLLMHGEPTIIIMVDPAVIYPETYFKDGVALIAIKHERYNCHAKSNNYIEGVKRSMEAQETGGHEPLYYNDDQVFEGATSNVFILQGGKLKTPKSNILAGITRETLLEILDLDVPVSVEDFTLDTLLEAEEIFTTGSGKEIVPVVKVNDTVIGDGKVGPLTREVTRQFRDYTLSGKWQEKRETFS